MSLDGSTWVWLRGVGLVAGAALFWLAYFDLKDSLRKEPRRLLVLAFLLGAAAAAAALGGYRVAELAGVPDQPGRSWGAILLYTFGVVGPLEEGAKYLVAVAIVFRWREFDEPIDGLVYAAAIAIGFASVETLLYAPYLGPAETLARAVASPLTHSLFAVVWGLGIGRARFVARGRAERLAWHGGSLLAAMLLHGLYDALLLAWNATYTASGTILVLWLFLLWRARAARSRIVSAGGRG